MASGLKMVKEDLGPDALILSTRTLRGGKLGMLGKPVLEITAAIDSTWPEQNNEPSFPQDNSSSFSPVQAQNHEPLTYQNLGMNEPLHRKNKYSETAETKRTETGADPTALSREISELRSIIDSLSHRIGGLDSSPIAPAYVEPEYSARTTNESEDPVIRLLLSRGLNHQVAGLVARFTGDVIGPQNGSGQQTLSANLT
ncbi:MAG TPA: hypothetical protein ENK89_00460, partial [Desulfobulbaceae bacterium]|nr:hypothetical protein [Desulfobulbaceae bacterium]